ncbi:tripartite tricarboxylate transporter TctB family protein [Paracandidimonas soli]|uniref:Putative tricarboxylic transport membrane protein n=1 Tax=Paracandidimonas soli TaxID=1917182 RepID=A0A4R3V988_9BURK|nr:tripartite tricarboxylate transporter TctB family protein [Paracandidimonas soli]TCV01746.1 putative tricarboxylic transport membrane protein [Paracandidimonas soli]
MNDRILGIASLLLAIFLTWQSYGMEAPFSYEPLGPNAFPLMIAFIIGVCGLILIVKGSLIVDRNPPGANARIASMVICIAAYAFLFQWAGFVIATAGMTAIVGRLFGGKWLWTILSGVILGVAFFLLFDKALDVVLPTGLLGDLL